MSEFTKNTKEELEKILDRVVRYASEIMNIVRQELELISGQRDWQQFPENKEKIKTYSSMLAFYEPLIEYWGGSSSKLQTELAPILAGIKKTLDTRH